MTQVDTKDFEMVARMVYLTVDLMAAKRGQGLAYVSAGQMDAQQAGLKEALTGE